VDPGDKRRDDRELERTAAWFQQRIARP